METRRQDNMGVTLELTSTSSALGGVSLLRSFAKKENCLVSPRNITGNNLGELFGKRTQPRSQSLSSYRRSLQGAVRRETLETRLKQTQCWWEGGRGPVMDWHLRSKFMLQKLEIGSFSHLKSNRLKEGISLKFE